MITNDISWSLGSCPNKSLNPVEPTVPPHLPSDPTAFSSGKHFVLSARHISPLVALAVHHPRQSTNFSFDANPFECPTSILAQPIPAAPHLIVVEPEHPAATEASTPTYTRSTSVHTRPPKSLRLPALKNFSFAVNPVLIFFLPRSAFCFSSTVDIRPHNLLTPMNWKLPALL